MEDEESTAGEGPAPSSGETRQLLIRFQARDDEATAELLRRFSRELHAIAVQHMRGERVGHTLQPTALVNEAYIRLVGLDQMDWQDRAHFLGMAARTMRRVLVDHARKKRAKKRGSGVTLLSLQDSDGLVDVNDDYDLLDLDEALERLGKLSERQAQVIDLRFFGGLSISETAETLKVSPETVKNEARFALAWLKSRLNPS
jgi:RNA polymerase sigma factor (TIGR02999 family)